MVNQNKIFSFKIKRQAKNLFPSDVKRTVAVEQQPALKNKRLKNFASVGRASTLWPGIRGFNAHPSRTKVKKEKKKKVPGQLLYCFAGPYKYRNAPKYRKAHGYTKKHLYMVGKKNVLFV